MLRRLSPIILVIAALIALASPAAAATAGAPAARSGGTADHLGGSFGVCGRIVEFTAPIVGTDGSLTVAGIVDGADHSFTIDEGATVSALLPPLATAGEWTCLSLTGDGMGVLVDVNVAAMSPCAPLTLESGTFVLRPGSTHPSTTTTFDGDAGAWLAADADLTALLESITLVASIDWAPDAAEVCVEVGLAGDGSFASLLIDYTASPGSAGHAPIACGMVNGTPIAYRDPASQPFPEGTEVGVAGFFIDASLLSGPALEVLAFHLDAIGEVCLFGEVVDNALVAASVVSAVDTEVCGELEVQGGLVFVEAVVVSQGLTAINFAEPTPESIALACWAARSPTGTPSGLLIVCGDFEGATADTFTVSGVTFHLETAIDDSDLPATGGPQAVALIGPDPFEPFGPANPARVTTATLAGCATAQPSPSPLPDTSVAATDDSGASGALLLGLLAVFAGGGVALAAVRARRR